jgi:hypothetical protein
MADQPDDGVPDGARDDLPDDMPEGADDMDARGPR